MSNSFTSLRLNPEALRLAVVVTGKVDLAAVVTVASSVAYDLKGNC